jgi:molybdenum cofactor synthesis domain-containing protein
MKPLRVLLPFEDALETVAKHISPMDRTEEVPLDEAGGRVLADDLTAKYDTPPFDRGLMDGYAVKAGDTKGASAEKPVRLALTGVIHAGETPKVAIGTGQCVQSATGAMLAEGADAVVKVEDTSSDGGVIEIHAEAAPQTNVSKKGSDIRAGDIILKAGTYLDPSKVGVLASQGLERVRVFAKPRVGIMSSGEEVVEQGIPLQPGQLYDINSFTIASVVRENGGEPQRLGILHDEVADIREKISRALRDYDVLVFSGGSSAGEKDYIAEVIQEKGIILFHGLQIKPGKPTMFAIIEEKPVFGMPGTPASAVINAVHFIGPALRTMAHLPAKKKETVEARLSRTTTGDKGRVQFMTVRLENGEAVPVFVESSAITSIARADGYFRIEVGQTVEKGTTVKVTLF